MKLHTTYTEFLNSVAKSAQYCSNYERATAPCKPSGPKRSLTIQPDWGTALYTFMRFATGLSRATLSARIAGILVGAGYALILGLVCVSQHWR